MLQYIKEAKKGLYVCASIRMVHPGTDLPAPLSSGGHPQDSTRYYECTLRPWDSKHYSYYYCTLAPLGNYTQVIVYTTTGELHPGKGTNSRHYKYCT